MEQCTGKRFEVSRRFTTVHYCFTNEKLLRSVFFEIKYYFVYAIANCVHFDFWMYHENIPEMIPKFQGKKRPLAG